MIVQTAPPNQPHLVITQIDHAQLSGDFAAVFGNNNFAPLDPTEAMHFVAAHHDDGWAETDAACQMDVNTGLPYHLTQTPLTELLKTSERSPKENESRYPYSGLMSSMHTYGLFNGRYGLSDKIFIDLIPAEHKPAMQAMLDDEVARQNRIKNQLNQTEESARLVQEEVLFSNYKLLQFFDTLALYFHITHREARRESAFLNVPQSVGQDVEITIKPIKDGKYALTPYPFNDPELSFSYQGRYLAPQPIGTDLQKLMSETALSHETITLVDGGA